MRLCAPSGKSRDLRSTALPVLVLFPGFPTPFPFFLPTGVPDSLPAGFPAFPFFFAEPGVDLAPRLILPLFTLDILIKLRFASVDIEDSPTKLIPQSSSYATNVRAIDSKLEWLGDSGACG